MSGLGTDEKKQGFRSIRPPRRTAMFPLCSARVPCLRSNISRLCWGMAAAANSRPS